MRWKAFFFLKDGGKKDEDENNKEKCTLMRIVSDGARTEGRGHILSGLLRVFQHAFLKTLITSAKELKECSEMRCKACLEQEGGSHPSLFC